MSEFVIPREGGLRQALADSMVVAKRNLIRYPRVPQLIIFSTIQPAMFVLLFTFVFGGAIEATGTTNYVDFLLPGVFVQNALFGSMQTGIGLATDLQSGIIDRFRSLPMARSAVLAGRTFADAVRVLFVVTLMVLVGTAVGFRFHAGPVSAVGAIALAVLIGYSVSWISAVVGMKVREPESVQAASFVWVFPLVFASSAFVPTQTMPGWLQTWADVSPVTRFVDALRALVLGGPLTNKLAWALVWLAITLVVAVPAAIRVYRRT
jgi:ABC transporter DrrB family efflux protein